ncbi:uncharacterized protein EURHEDRAFT_378221 [Aspergillus ruber CBS 135680]|uniref:Uncharacterized protein n=1 Tax=Aspergillus ruber (strain CBS 135680) TaxID=1388766 RepID=A0A017SBB8_ASPRC|nr:uncharacterized protein EURHEDRAFT_378221 [Aspergillus ruber CBS 135680]EYE94338.1 hypothetical protein EURHEDRAFT_378221 [Aspergillus ruber CBS 135680]
MGTPIYSPSPRLDRFQQSLESVYGPFTSIPDPNAWIPPRKSGGHRGRYLWTDAYGVLNLLTMHREYTNTLDLTANTSEKEKNRYLIMAERLVEVVHDVLGKTRDGISRLPGANEENVVGGGLRIGKEEEGGMDGDGQYHHYLTVWMFALNRLSMATGDPKYNRQAVALAKAIHPRFFVNRESNRPRMVWKMAMDLSVPLVQSEGNLDPIDGFVVFRLLQAAAVRFEGAAGEGVLSEEIDDYQRVMARKGEHFVSSDPLDLGMTLWTAHWFSEREEWAARLAGRCFEQLYDLFEINRYLERNIKYRLAFREFGTSLGAQCQSQQSTEKDRAVDLKHYADAIIAAWDPYMELTMSSDLMHDDLRPITRVMYATALMPGAFQYGYFGPEPKSILGK